MTSLSPDFVFSQSSLQDFVDCRQKFWLRYVDHVSWPAPGTGFRREQELRIRRGKEFHRLIQRYFNGLPVDLLTEAADRDMDLAAWWARFLARFDDKLPQVRYAEMPLAASIANRRLMALFDLVILMPAGNLVIYDWKSSEKKPKRSTLAGKLQTRVYLWLLSKQGKDMFPQWNGDANSVSMSYWYTDGDSELEPFPYSADRMTEDEAYLAELVQEASAMPQSALLPGENPRACQFCPYPSYCGQSILRDGDDGDFGTVDDLGDLNFDLESIEPIAL